MAVITSSVTREMRGTFNYHCDHASWHLHAFHRSLLTKLNMSVIFHCGSDQHKRFFFCNKYARSWSYQAFVTSQSICVVTWFFRAYHSLIFCADLWDMNTENTVEKWEVNKVNSLLAVCRNNLRVRRRGIGVSQAPHRLTNIIPTIFF